MRQALLMAIDRKGIVKAGAGGVADVADSLVSSNTWSGTPDSTVKGLLKALPSYPYDPVKAKALAAQAGVAGQKVVIAAARWTPRPPSSPRLSHRPPRPSG